MADGVGGWNELGIDPALYSRELCANVAKNYEMWELTSNINDNSSVIKEDTLKNILVRSVKETTSLGSSTISILLLDSINKTVYSAYLGDSLYMILRQSGEGRFEVFYKCEDQSHGFNIPFQVGKDGDNPGLAKTNKHIIMEHDIIIQASDG